jgi:large subunit ribosomal protein L4
MKARDKAIIVLEDFNLSEPKTSSFLNVLKALNIDDKKSLLVLGEQNKNVYLSSRNLKNSKVVTNSELNTYKITNASNLVLSESAIADLELILNKV